MSAIGNHNCSGRGWVYKDHCSSPSTELCTIERKRVHTIFGRLKSLLIASDSNCKCMYVCQCTAELCMRANFKLTPTHVLCTWYIHVSIIVYKIRRKVYCALYSVSTKTVVEGQQLSSVCVCVCVCVCVRACVHA